MSNNTLQVLVREKRAEAEDICVVELAPCDGAPLPPFEPGAHGDVHECPPCCSRAKGSRLVPDL